MAMMMKLRTYAKKVGHIFANEAGVGSCGAFNSKTMMVMRMAITPSLNASIRLVFMDRKCNTGRPARKPAVFEVRDQPRNNRGRPLATGQKPEVRARAF